MARGVDGRVIEHGRVTVTLDASGEGSASVSFGETFVATPTIALYTPAGDAGTYTSTSTSKTGFTVAVSGSDLTSRDVYVYWVAIGE